MKLEAGLVPTKKVAFGKAICKLIRKTKAS